MLISLLVMRENTKLIEDNKLDVECPSNELAEAESFKEQAWHDYNHVNEEDSYGLMNCYCVANYYKLGHQRLPEVKAIDFSEFLLDNGEPD